MDLLTQAGLSLTAVIVASNTLTNLFKFLLENSKYKVEFTRLLNFGFSILITGIMVSMMNIEGTEIVGIILAVIGAIGSENVHESNKPVEDKYLSDVVE